MSVVLGGIMSTGLKGLLILVCLLVCCLSITEGILCYQCGDSHGNQKTAHCQYGVKGLAAQRAMHQDKNTSVEKLANVKNCSHYVDNYYRERYKFCQITTVESYGQINAYIRDCADGRQFSAQLNVSRLQYIRADNQTICGYSHLQIATICVRMCDTDFCNGPLAAAGGLSLSIVLVSMSLMCTVLGYFVT